MSTTKVSEASEPKPIAEVVTKCLRRDIDLSLFGYEGKLALLTLDNGLDYNRPNTFGEEGLKLLSAMLDEVSSDSTIDVVAITGKPYILAAGADLSKISQVHKREQAVETGRFGHQVFHKLAQLGKPSFAFINGLALGGGLEIALHCQYRTVATNATLALPEVFLGLVPGWGGAYLLPRLIGPEAAVQVIVGNPLNNNRMLSGTQSLELGIVDAVFSPPDFLEHSVGFVADILSGKKSIIRTDHTGDAKSWQRAIATGNAAAAKKYGGADVDAPTRALELIAAARTSTAEQGFEAENQALADLIMTDELRASLYAFNLIQKKSKKVEGAPKPSLAKKVTRVGIVGAGLMASQLALLFIRRLKLPVVITDLDQERVDKGIAYIHAEIAKLVDKGRISRDAGNRLTGLISGSVDQQVYASCDFVLEAVFEDMAVKQKLLTALEAIVSPDCVLATNTSSLRVEEMSKHLSHPERVVGFHFFNPVALMPLLEVARTQFTDDESVATAIWIGKELKKTMVIVKDAPGFVVNRLLSIFWGEVTDAFDEGTPLDTADNALMSLGLPMTPFTLFGLVGPAVALHVSEILNQTLGERFGVSANMKTIVEGGIKTFYIKDDSGKLVANPAVSAVVKQGNQVSTSEQVRQRALIALAKEARLMLDESVVSTPDEINLCMMLGAGWPLRLGGILPYLDNTGISESATGQRFHSKGIASLPA
ncbi:MAG TPA: 3-hydroxyacyl-CoA dehydrogenase NAD-binding domain-containing protein [Candidatus Nanopelagicaceae bacterium]|nr:3-hydroxyacyl-CoA dehydrogenase NAD-binding domain-containing protein [Candidatus Nanopelagicaceae bacterium]